MTSLPRTNAQVLLKARPHGIPQAEHFEVVEAPLTASMRLLEKGN